MDMPRRESMVQENYGPAGEGGFFGQQEDVQPT
jgi:hypothetical protein